MASLLSVAMVLILVSLSTTTSWASYCPGGYFTPGSPYSSSLKAVATILPRRVGSSPVLFASESITSCGGGGSTHSHNAGEAHLLHSCLRVRLLLHARVGRLRIRAMMARLSKLNMREMCCYGFWRCKGCLSIQGGRVYIP